MIKNAINIIRFLFSVIKIHFKLPKAKKLLETKGKDAAFDKAMEITRNHIDETIDIIHMDLKITGTENIPDEPVVFMGNHQSYIDIYVMLKAIDRRVILIAKKELAKIPIINRLSTYLQVLYMERDNPRKDLLTIREAINIIKSGGYDVLI